MENEISVDSLGSFIDTVSYIRDVEWKVKAKNELWFRGEGDDYKESKLRPGLYRRYDSKTLKSPLDLIDIEDELFAHFRRCSTELARAETAGDESGDPWAEYFQMQHHGGPTRLLDWSDGALVALHFALREERICDEYKRNRRVYVLDPYWLIDHIKTESNDHIAAKNSWKEYCHKYSTQKLDEDDWDDCYLPNGDGHEYLPVPKYPLVLEYDHFTRRVSAQRSRFLVMGSAPDFFNQLLLRVEIKIKTITIDPNSVAKMRVQLRDAGLTESVIFPDLDGLGRESKHLWIERLQEST